MGRRGEGHLYRNGNSGSWRIRWFFEGKRYDESTGTTDLDKARKIARQKTATTSALGDVRALNARLEKAKDEQMVLEAKHNPSLNLFRMIEAFKSCDIVRRKNNSAATRRRWDNLGNLLIDKFGGNTEMRQLTREMCEEFMREYETKVSSATFNTALWFFKRVWSVLAKYDSPTELKARLPNGQSPWDYITPMKKGEVVGKRPFTKEQLTRIWRVLDEMKNPDLTMLFDLARNTGARLHDLVSWKWDTNMRFETTDEGKMRAVVEWKPIKTKNSTGKLMVIPILDDRVVMNLYDRYTSREVEEELVLPKMLELYNHNKACQLTRLTQSVFLKAGIKTMEKVEGNARSNCVFGMHSFRSSLVTELFEKGVDLGRIAHLYTGHGSTLMTELYAKAGIDTKVFDLSKLAHVKTEQVKPPKWIPQLTEADKRFYDEVETSDLSKPAKIYLKSLIQFKDKKALIEIRTFLDKRIQQL